MYFYSHIIEIETIISGLNDMDLDDTQRGHLAKLVDSTIHHTVLDMILSKLSTEEKRVFLNQLQKDPKDKALLEFVKQRSDSIEDEIKGLVEELKKELQEDINEAKRLKKGNK
jgi:hypothetical protein